MTTLAAEHTCRRRAPSGLWRSGRESRQGVLVLVSALASRLVSSRASRLALPVACGAVALLGACSSPPEIRFAGDTMGTTYAVKVVGRFDDAGARAMATEIEATLARINDRMSTYIRDSELSRLNHSRRADWIPISDELFLVINEAQRISRLTDGAFDMTVGPLVNLWGFGPDEVNEKPSAQSIASVLAAVGYQNVAVRAAMDEAPPMLRKTRADIYIDLSAIAKGYAVDALAQVLLDKGAEHFLVEIGGELRVSGQAAGGRAWRVGIERPVEGGRGAFQVLNVGRAGIATSGNYHNYREFDGERYAHEINTRTGYPVKHHTASVTVVAETAMEADALATALFIMGADEGLAFAERAGIAAYFIEWRDGRFVTRSTPKMQPFLA